MVWTDNENAGMGQHIVLCSITTREIIAALHTNESCDMINSNNEKRYILTASENKKGRISGNLQF